MDSPDCYEVTTRTKAKAGYNWWIQPTTFGGKNIISPFIHSKNEAFAWQKRYQNVSFCFKGKIKSRCGSASEVKLKTSTPTPKVTPPCPSSANLHEDGGSMSVVFISFLFRKSLLADFPTTNIY